MTGVMASVFVNNIDGDIIFWLH